MSKCEVVVPLEKLNSVKNEEYISMSNTSGWRNGISSRWNIKMVCWKNWKLN